MESGTLTRSVSRPIRVIEEVGALPSIDKARIARLLEREQAVEDKARALESAEPIVRMAREPRYYSFYVSTLAIRLTPGGDIRPETLGEADQSSRVVLGAMFATDAKRYRLLHDLSAFEPPSIDLIQLAGANLLFRAQTVLSEVVKEGFVKITREADNQDLNRLQAEIEERVTRSVGLKVEIEVEYDRIENQLSVGRALTRRRQGTNLDVRG